MKLIIRSTLQLTFIMLLMAPLPALAIPAITCHCFTDRSYDPARPTMADPYFLATSQNSFFAAAFKIDKKMIVMKKQRGVSATDLWVSHWLASKTGTDPESLLQARKTKATWQQVITPLRVPEKAIGKQFAEALKANAADDRLADLVVDELLLRFRLYGEAELGTMRKAGAGNQEIILASLIAFKTRQPPSALYHEVKKGSKSWGTQLTYADIAPAEIQKEYEGLINRNR
ncbi:hypothetical protein [Pelotalea chapellei]|uniref:Uncharacterized protein n=1 Tax=Pelotalea chapellei TaxID=44671 RepID=A0ABS5UAZ7_9BACT|nr:hypothetical protein [Pelotalea chapellei]MBT1072857.1 hypothetical protein [Pelotalea chapellei]